MQLSWSLRLLPLAAPLLVSSIAKAQSVEPPVTGKGLVGGALLGGEVVVLAEAAIKVKPAWAYYVGAGVGAIGGGIGGHYLESSLSSKSAMYMLSAGMLLVIPATVAAMNAASYDTPLEYTQDNAPVDQPSDEFPSGPTNPGSEMPTMPAVNPEAPPSSVAPSAPAVASPPVPATPPPAAPAPTTAPAPATPPSSTTPPSGAPPAPQPQGARTRSMKHAVAHWRAAPAVTPPALFQYSGSELALSVPSIEIRDTYTRREVAMYGVKQQAEVRVPLLQMAF